MKGKGIQLDESTQDIIIFPTVGANGLISGGLSVGNVTYQNQYFLLMAQKGEYKLSPTIGVGIGDMVLDEDILYWRTEIANQLRQDGQQVKRIHITDQKVEIDASYNT
jgi:hypothetical protein